MSHNINSTSMHSLHTLPITLDGTDIAVKREEIKEYFHKTYSLFEKLFDCFKDEDVFYLKSELIQQSIVENEKLYFTLISIGNTVNGFKTKNTNLILKNNQIIEDTITKSNWDITGKHLSGTIKSDLEKISISDEYWFSWKKFHPESKLLRLNK